MTTLVNITRKRGDTRRIIFVVSDALGNLVDISLWTNFLLTVDPSKVPTDDTANVMQLTGVFITDGTDSKIGFTPTGATAIGSYYYDVQALDANGEKITISEGKYKLKQDITKD